MKKIILILMVAISIFGSLSTIKVFAQQQNESLEYTLLTPLPCVGGDCTQAAQKTTMEKYLPGAFQLAIGLSAVWAVLMIVIGGFQYISTDAIMKKSEGRERIKNAIFGLVLVIGSWLILNTINPNLLKINLNIESAITPEVVGGTLDLITSSPALPIGDVMSKITETCPKCSTAGGLKYNISPENLARFSCQNCSSITGGITGNGNTNMNVAPDLNNGLSALNNGLKEQDVGWKVSEAFPPVVNHSDSCHYNGSCVDATLNSPTAENIKRFTDTAKNNGLSPSYEVKTQADATKLINDLKALGMQNPENVVKINTKTNGAHFHLKK